MDQNTLARLTRTLGHILQEGQVLTFQKGQVLYYEGHNPYGVFVLQDGKVGFQKGHRPCPGDHLVSTPHGQILGLDHFLESTPFCCHCIAATDCRLIFLSKSQLSPLL